MLRRLLLAVSVLFASVAAIAALDGHLPAEADASGGPIASGEEAEDPSPWPQQGSLDADGPGALIEADGEEMPGSTGWFLIPILADEPTPVQVDLGPKLDSTDDQPKIATTLLLQHDEISTHLMAAGQDEGTSVHAGNHTVDCCTARFDGERGRADLGGWYGTAPESPLYLGLAAVGWSEGDEITIQARGQRADVWAGPTLTGTDVEAVNLFERAREDPHVRVEGDNVVGGHEDVELGWTARDNALVTVRWDLEEARADVEVSLPDGTSVGNDVSSATWGRISAAGGPGDVELSFANASREHPREGEAFALVADVDAPHRTLDAWEADP